MKELNHIWVLYGGSSAEREVSLKSGKNIAAALNAKGFHVELFDVRAGESLMALRWETPPDMVFLGLHGTFGEDGTIQGYLESIKVPFVGSPSFSSALCFDKITTKLLLHSTGIPCIPSFHLFSEKDLDSFLSDPKIEAELSTKRYFVKASRQGSSIGAYRYDPRAHQEPLLEFRRLCYEAFRFDSRILIEEWVEGTELTVTVLNGKALPVVEICPKEDFFDYEHKYTKGKSDYFCPARIDAEVFERIQFYAERAYTILGNQDYCRMDFLLDKEGQPFALEMNTLPGMTDTSLTPMAAKAIGMDYPSFLKELVLSSYRRQKVL